jgi:hypothetical protein
MPEEPSRDLLIQNLQVKLSPIETEIISRRDLRQLIKLSIQFRPNKWDELVEHGKNIIRQNSFISFLLGKQSAANEAHIDFWTVEANDFPVLDPLREQYCSDFEQLMTDFQVALNSPDPVDLDIFIRRAELIGQSLAWTIYNKAKIALWDDEIFERPKDQPIEVRKRWIQQAQRYTYEGMFMFKTEADEAVCEICAPLSGEMSVDPLDFPQPQLHPNCRCEIVAIPTTALLDEQTKFRQEFLEEMEEEPSPIYYLTPME